MCYCDTSASAYTSAGPLSLKQNGVYTFVITSGCTDCPLRTQFTVSAATAGSTTLGVAVGPRQLIADQLLAKAFVIRAMHERAQLCQDPQTEFALLRESLRVSRINHILRVHGHMILQGKRAAEIYDEVGQSSWEALPGFTEDNMT